MKGVKTNTKNFTKPATFIETLSGLVIAYVLGIISAKTKIKKVIVNVATITPLSWKRAVIKEVAREVARILTKLFPNSNAPSKLSPFSFRAKALAAIFEPLALSAVSFALLAPVKAVSDPEKKAEIINNPRIESDINQKPESDKHILFLS